MKRSYPSGAQKRKEKKAKEDEATKYSHKLTSWINKSDKVQAQQTTMDGIGDCNISSEIRELELDGRVGLDFLPAQLMKRSMHQGFVFNILCVGETGIGKSSLMCSLFNNNKMYNGPSPQNLSDVKMKVNSYSMDEGEVNLKLTIVETMGLNDQINKTRNFEPITDYIDKQFEAYLQEELQVKRSMSTYHDTRIHACLYFICPTGRSMKAGDLVGMKCLHQKVNLLPLIAKSDTLSKQELEQFKMNIRSELQKQEINVYQFPACDLGQSANQRVPFAVLGSKDFVRADGREVRARCYPWGTVFVEHENHSDFTLLRNVLVEDNMEDMRELTHERHYELYRRKRLVDLGHVDGCGDGINVMNVYQNAQESLWREFQAREMQVKDSFTQRVKQKERELREAETEMKRKYESLFKNLGLEAKRLEEMEVKLEEEINEFKKEGCSSKGSRRTIKTNVTGIAS